MRDSNRRTDVRRSWLSIRSSRESFRFIRQVSHVIRGFWAMLRRGTNHGSLCRPSHLADNGGAQQASDRLCYGVRWRRSRLCSLHPLTLCVCLCEVTELEGSEGRLTAISLRWPKSAAIASRPIPHLFPLIGAQPHTD